MDVEVLLVADCPHELAAVCAAQEALRLAGMGGTVVTTVVTSTAQAHRLGFVGSPSFVVAGRDVFAVPGAEPGLACRVYATEAGPRGVPSVEMLRDALLRVCAYPASAAAGPAADADADRAR